jgi:PAS domain S-box-containing protein
VTDSPSPLRVLVVEDSADDAELATRALRDGGLVVAARIVATAPELRAVLPEFAPELILSDWALPGFSGAAAVAIAHAWDSNVPCILVSGTLGEELVVEALHTGATDYVLKQRLEALVPAVRRALAEAAERREHARLEAELAATQAAMRGSLDAMADAFLVATAIRDDHGIIVDFRVAFANRAAGAFMSTEASTLIGRSFRQSMASLGAGFYDSCVGVVETGLSHAMDGVGLAGPYATVPRDGLLVNMTIARFEDGFFLVFRDVTERTWLGRERDRLAAVVQQAADAIVITDTAGRIAYANPVFEAEIGARLSELRGRSMPTVLAGAIPPATIGEIDRAVRGGGGWLGEVMQRLADGTSRHTQLSVTPSLGSDGSAASIVTVLRDVSELREAQADAELEMRIRAVLAESLHAIPEGASVEAAAQAICDQLATLPFVDMAAVQVFLGDRDVQIMAQSGLAEYPVPVGTHLPPLRASIVRERAAVGPWAEYLSADPADGWMPARAAGIKALAFGPIGHGDHVAGVLLIGTLEDRIAHTLVEKMPGIISFSTTLSALLAERLHVLRREAELRDLMAVILAAGAFHPVFQPIVDLGGGAVVAFEALTRFDSGQRPDLCFADAWAVGLGPELELATLEAAVEAGRRLAPGLWLDLNVSPRLLADPERLRPILWSAERPLVLEVTEHEVIEDYDVVREAIRELGRDIRLAVDDAGAGVANFGHIIDLRPDFVKLDISLVRRVNANLGRQAMVVGMRHFARTAGCRLIAEGVETAEEARTLTALGVEFGQGYLFGHPEPVEVAANQ